MLISRKMKEISTKEPLTEEKYEEVHQTEENNEAAIFIENAEV